MSLGEHVPDDSLAWRNDNEHVQCLGPPPLRNGVFRKDRQVTHSKQSLTYWSFVFPAFLPYSNPVYIRAYS